MRARVIRRGGELVVVIPEEVASSENLRENTEVVVKTARKRLTLGQLLEGVTEENRHPETDWGPDVGNERWEY
jgi:antitoxin MazE